jgi:hypothetical protein
VREAIKMKNKNETGRVFEIAEKILHPFAVAVRLQMALIRKVLYTAFALDLQIARWKKKRKDHRLALEWKKEAWLPRLKYQIKG